MSETRPGRNDTDYNDRSRNSDPFRIRLSLPDTSFHLDEETEVEAPVDREEYSVSGIEPTTFKVLELLRRISAETHEEVKNGFDSETLSLRSNIITTVRCSQSCHGNAVGIPAYH
jgi:hypothetical protein